MSSTTDAHPQPDCHRVFFALWPDDVIRAAISRATRGAVRASGGRPVAKERLHVTVAFLGELTAAGLDVVRAVPPISVGPFELALDTIGVWPESRVLWLAPAAAPAALFDLESRLWEALTQRGFRAEQRVYRPHVTLARRARSAPAASEVIRWPVRELALVESFPAVRSVHYEVLARWPL